MKLTVLGSGSRGNAVVVTASGVSILLDAGFGPRALRKRAERAGVDLDALVGIVLTHEHGDHARGAAAMARQAGCPVYASRGTLHAMRTRLDGVPRVSLASHDTTAVGPFSVTTCPTTHDAHEPIALAVSATGNHAKLCLAYDLGRPTSALRYLMRDATCLLMEANHDEVMLRTGPYPPAIRDRIGGSRGHLSNRAAGELLADLCHEDLRSIVLVHLSERCNRPDLAEREVRRHVAEAGFLGTLFVARQEEPLHPMHLAPESGQLELGLAG